MDFLKSAVASAISKGPLAAYALTDRVDLDQSIWTLHNATKREGNVNCSVFTFDASAAKSRLPIARNAVRKSRTLHHPGVVKVLDTIENETHIYIVTERVTPVTWYTKRNNLAEETIKWGLSGIARTVKFINDEAKSVHGCIRASSVFSSDSGEWKLGSFELLSSMNEEDAVIYSHSALVPDLGRYLPPEVGKNGWDTIKRHPLSAVDSWGYGVLVSEIFNGTFTGSEQASQPRNIPPSMQQNFKRLTNSNPKLRLSTAQFFEQGRRSGGYFQTPLINVSEGIDGLGLKSEGERDEFLTELNEVSNDFPDNYLKRKVLPELLKSVEFGGGGAKVFSVVLQIGSKLSGEEYETHMTPVIIRLFSSPDRAIRVCLLDNLPLMIDHLQQKIVNDKIFPNLVTGFTDVAPVVREQTVKSVLIVIPKLSERIINGELLKYLAKTANDGEPGIRTNTTICLGKIARQLGPSTRSKVLTAAFTRSLRDPFVHARNAALMALNATMDLFSEEDCANKFLPAICPALVDKEKVVRDQANKTMDAYVARVRKYAVTLPETAIPPAGSSSASSGAPRMGTPSNVGDSASSWAGWAISSFTNKVASTEGQIQQKNVPSGPSSTSLNGTPRIGSPAGRPASVSQPRGMNLTRNNTETTKVAQSFTSPAAAAASTQSPAPSTGGDDDFWDQEFGGDDDPATNGDDDGGWGAMNDDFDESAAATTTTTTTTTTSTARTSTSSAPRTAPAFDDKGEPDFAGWLKAQQSKTVGSKTLPKGLGTKKSTMPASSASAAAAAVKKPITKPAVKKEAPPPEDDEGWGDAWE